MFPATDRLVAVVRNMGWSGEEHGDGVAVSHADREDLRSDSAEGVRYPSAWDASCGVRYYGPEASQP